MRILLLRRISLLVLICLLAGAPGWAQAFGEPSMVDTIRSISPDLVTFSGREDDIPVFESVGANFLFAPPIHLADVEAEESVATFGKGQFGSGWCYPCGDIANQRIHLGTDLAVGPSENAINIYSMSDGEVVFSDPDSGGWGCHIVVRHELSPGREYPYEVIVEWQDVAGSRLIVQGGELMTEGERLIGPEEPVFPRSSRMERFLTGVERPYRYLYLDYQHIVPLGSTRQACAIDAQVEKGEILGTIDPATTPSHVHIHARYAESTDADELESELKAGTAVYKREDIFRNGELVREAITRYRVGITDYQGSMPVVNPLWLAYTPPLNDVPIPFRDVPKTEWYAEYVLGAWERGVISGVGDTGFFQPTRNINFAEFFKMLVLASEVSLRSCNDGENPVSEFGNLFPPYSAAKKEPWYCSYYKTVVEEGWFAPYWALRGENQGRRGVPADPILRQEVAFFLARILPPSDEPAAPGFPDVDVDNPFREEIGRLHVEGIVQGDKEGRFNPTQEIIRAEIVKVLELLFNKDRYKESPEERP